MKKQTLIGVALIQVTIMLASLPTYAENVENIWEEAFPHPEREGGLISNPAAGSLESSLGDSSDEDRMSSNRPGRKELKH